MRLCIIHIRVHTGYCIHTYSREKCTRSIVLINLKLLVCSSSCHQSFTHFIFICLWTLLHKTVECGHSSYVEAKKMTFLDYFLQMLNILTYLYRRDMYNNANHLTPFPSQLLKCLSFCTCTLFESSTQLWSSYF